MAAEVRAGEKAVTAGVKQATDGLKLAMRRQVSLKAAGIVCTNAPKR